MTSHVIASDRCAPAARRQSRGVATRLFSLARLWKSRRDLADLDAHMLRDIGLTETQAKCEAERPIWDVPSNWRQ